MAMLDELFKGNMLTAVAVGLGAVFLAPLAGPVLRPAAKAAIKSGMLAYQGLAELGEAVVDIVGEAQAELAFHRAAEIEAAAAGRKTRRRGQEATS